MTQQSHSWVFVLQKWTLNSHKNCYTVICSSFIPDSQKLEATQMSFSGRMNKQSVVQSIQCNTIHYKKGQTIDTCNTLDEFQRHTEWDKPASKGCILYDSIYLTQGIAQGALWMAELFYILIVVMVAHVKIYRIIYQRKKVTFTVW